MARFSSSRSTASATEPYSSRGDFIRGSGSDDVIGFRQEGFTQVQVDLAALVNALGIPPVFGLPNTPAAAALILNALSIPQFPDQADLVPALVELESAFESVGLNLDRWDTPIEALNSVRANASFFGIDTEFGGNDRIFGRGGNDTIMDLEGHNRVQTGDGDDTIYLGTGNDRVTDTGGNNTITDLGGNNTITLLATTSFADPFVGTDVVNTGDGNDNINAFDGKNIIDAGNGNNTVRGGDNYDEIKVGNGNDFVEVRGGFADEDANENGILDFGEDANFNGILDPADSVVFALLNTGQGFEAHNYVVDNGGDDTIRSTASASDQGDDLILSDLIMLESLAMTSSRLGPATTSLSMVGETTSCGPWKVTISYSHHLSWLETTTSPRGLAQTSSILVAAATR